MKLRKKLLRSCKYIVLRIFKLRFRKCLHIKFQRRKQAPQQRPINNTDSPKSSTKKIVSFKSVLRLLRIRRKTRDIVHDMDRIMELKSLSAAAENQEKPCIRTGKTTSSTNVCTGAGKKECPEIEEACRSLENYLVEMIMEEGTMKDLMDVEQLLYCWNNLRCPVFIHLVSTFYGELCKDLFSNN